MSTVSALMLHAADWGVFWRDCFKDTFSFGSTTKTNYPSCFVAQGLLAVYVMFLGLKASALAAVLASNNVPTDLEQGCVEFLVMPGTVADG